MLHASHSTRHDNRPGLRGSFFLTRLVHFHSATWHNLSPPLTVMTLNADEFIRRFLMHVVPDGFRRIRHFGFLANGQRGARLTTIRALLDVPTPIIDAPPCDYRK